MNCLLLGINAKIYALVFSALFLISLIIINILFNKLMDVKKGVGE